ncbi:Peptidase M23 [Caldalkalibacillus thermarum TA2.A1]|uniref:Peptidase M23 n=1 Tax=Caldalkalibacillus thermarum (strain TA2.A1) TaxID=986075 RepID=F5L4G5_CALTT|nr:peptidoglycan DD-metalloendopeptidase family protein [Caldalkalibacillus thermarum]EGL83776.1 Peptidase M23 [Caldalkalibacillus thermarum TA2.A1]QZT33710.1 peptidoglycan DD-metalloendopeptidase family protein [Caldalkalibacillus thermarum TA2.A1]
MIRRKTVLIVAVSASLFLLFFFLPLFLVGTVFGNIAKGDLTLTNEITEEDKKLRQKYVDAAESAFPGVKSHNAEELKYKLHWGLVYAIDMYSAQLNQKEKLPYNNIKKLAELLAPKFEYKESTITVVTETKKIVEREEVTETGETVIVQEEVVETETIVDEVLLLVTADTFRGTYFYSYEWETVEYEWDNTKVTITQEVVSGIDFQQSFERLDDVIKRYLDMDRVSEDDRTLILETAFSAGTGNEHFGFLIGLPGYSTYFNIGGVDFSNLPPEWIQAFQDAGQRYNVDWMILVAVAFVESSFNPNAVGPPNRTGELAQGLMQFLPSTWAIYGIDGDGDGKADPFNPIDAIYSAAYYLSVLGINNDPRQALYRYSGGSYAYADRVLSLAETMTVGGGSGRLAWPVPGHSRITSPLGPRVHPITGQRSFHNGVDIGAPRHVPVVAAEGGRVVTVVSHCREGNQSCGGGYGNYVVIDHGSGVRTVYAHLWSASVREGDDVLRGQIIGTVGSTGRSTGPHLHFEVRNNGSPVDPMPYLQFVY